MLPYRVSPASAWLLSRDLFEKTGVKPSQVGILVVNCSLFVPTPSWCAHIMNHFKMSGNTLSFNLGGMGCSGVCVGADAEAGWCWEGQGAIADITLLVNNSPCGHVARPGNMRDCWLNA